MWILGHKFHFLVDSIDHYREQQGNSIYLFWINTIFLQFDSLHIFGAFTCILQDSLTIFYFTLFPVFLKSKNSVHNLQWWVKFFIQKNDTTSFTFTYAIFSNTSQTHNNFSPFLLHIGYYYLYVQLVTTIVNFLTTISILKMLETENKNLFLNLFCSAL